MTYLYNFLDVFSTKKSCNKTLSIDDRTIEINSALFEEIAGKLVDTNEGECTWTITTSIIGTVKLTFSEFAYAAENTQTEDPFASFFENAMVEDSFGKRKKRSDSINEIQNLTLMKLVNKEIPATKTRPKRFSFDDLVAEDIVFGEDTTQSSNQLNTFNFGNLVPELDDEDATQPPIFDPCDNIIEVFDGPNEDSPRIGEKLCVGSGTKEITSTSISLFIKLSFKSTSTLDALKIDYTLASTYKLVNRYCFEIKTF